ncbi:hypothetical protein CKO13_11595 [Halorhodospira neutriphila]|uniref:phosphoglycerate mutase (2,3-diphosphoglycerate-dependent) n=1 Tax=Halorhodospira neutriphila TaxID=168379 RepID=A0ABS1E7Z4_9GAMM|nr:hypothetical protein [Halorhodospira neutriphila]
MPKTESLALTLERVLPFWETEIVPALKHRDCVLVAAHGNSLRALVKHLDDFADDEIMRVEIPTGRPLIYELDDRLRVERSYYL